MGIARNGPCPRRGCVHPGHARKLAARLENFGDKFFYDEAIEGGHAAGIVPEEDAQRVALEAVYLNLVLPQQPAPSPTERGF